MQCILFNFVTGFVADLLHNPLIGGRLLVTVTYLAVFEYYSLVDKAIDKEIFSYIPLKSKPLLR